MHARVSQFSKRRRSIRLRPGFDRVSRIYFNECFVRIYYDHTSNWRLCGSLWNIFIWTFIDQIATEALWSPLKKLMKTSHSNMYQLPCDWTLEELNFRSSFQSSFKRLSITYPLCLPRALFFEIQCTCVRFCIDWTSIGSL